MAPFVNRFLQDCLLCMDELIECIIIAQNIFSRKPSILWFGWLTTAQLLTKKLLISWS